MTEAIDAVEIGGESLKREFRVASLVCSAHFVSHVYFIVLPPLFAFIRADYGVSYADLGLVLATFSLVSTALQAPAGFLDDRGARGMSLVLALIVGASGMALAGTVPFYWALVAGWVLV